MIASRRFGIFLVVASVLTGGTSVSAVEIGLSRAPWAAAVPGDATHAAVVSRPAASLQQGRRVPGDHLIHRVSGQCEPSVFCPCPP